MKNCTRCLHERVLWKRASVLNVILIELNFCKRIWMNFSNEMELINWTVLSKPLWPLACVPLVSSQRIVPNDGWYQEFQSNLSRVYQIRMVWWISHVGPSKSSQEVKRKSHQRPWNSIWLLSRNFGRWKDQKNNREIKFRWQRQGLVENELPSNGNEYRYWANDIGHNRFHSNWLRAKRYFLPIRFPSHQFVTGNYQRNYCVSCRMRQRSFLPFILAMPLIVMTKADFVVCFIHCSFAFNSQHSTNVHTNIE